MLRSFEGGGGTYSGVLMQVNVIYYTPKPNVVYIPAIKGETRNFTSYQVLDSKINY